MIRTLRPVVAVFLFALAACGPDSANSTSSESLTTQASRKRASPRVQCGGFNGWISWTSDILGGGITVSGELWDTCGSGDTQLELGWTDTEPFGGGGHGATLATAGAKKTVGVNSQTNTGYGPAYIELRVCQHDGVCGSYEHF
jgi:hypothetical protein